MSFGSGSVDLDGVISYVAIFPNTKSYVSEAEVQRNMI